MIFKIKRFTIILLLSILMINCIGYVLGTVLVKSDLPVKADAIIVLSGGVNRIGKGIDLYKQGYAPYLILSNSSEDGMIAQTIVADVPQQSVLLETNADSTYKNALYTKQIMIQHHLHSAIVVSSNFHMLRTKMNFQRVYKDSGITLTYVSVDTPSFNPHFWWLNKNSFMIVCNEYIKLIGNLFGIEGNEYKSPLTKIDSALFK